jgi:cytosine/adenosine deaminase-related metal-dependent hydrolase
MVVMPGLIDGHGHAGHGLLKTLGTGPSGGWYPACETIYAEGSDEEFWHAEAMLTLLERLKFGTTTGVTFFGGGDSIMRVDDPAYGARRCEAIEEIGIREFLAVGPRRGPFPSKFARWDGDTKHDIETSFDQQMDTCQSLIDQWHGKANGRINLSLAFAVHKPGQGGLSPSELAEMREQASAVRDMSRRHGLLFTQDGHVQGSVKFAHEELDILGPDALLSHSIGLTDEEIAICAETDTRISHNPSSNFSINARCPVPEFLDAGVTVTLGSDGTAPDRSYDMFRHMFHCMHYQRSHFHDANYIPPGKALEMVTIDSARALGMEDEIGSLESGKKADVILVDMRKPHLYPMNMPVHRITYFANGNDVDTVIVNGKILMRNRQVSHIDESEILDAAQRATDKALERTGLRHLLELPDGFWGQSRYPES